jgi:hypothetical protein
MQKWVWDEKPLLVIPTDCTVKNGGSKMMPKKEPGMEGRMSGDDVEFETIKAEEVKFGKNNFIEVARKKAKTSDGENEFISISRGFFLPDGSKRFKKSITVPDDKSVKEFVSKKIAEF